MANRLKKYTILIFVIIGLVFLGIGCAGKSSGVSPLTQNVSETPLQQANATEPTKGTNASGVQSISVKGSDTILPLAEAEAEGFMKENPGKSISVTGGGSGVGIAAFINGQVDIATSSREITYNEIETAKKNGINPVEHTIAYDGITLIVNPLNPVSNLNFTQLRGIYNGSISNWKDIGGQDKLIAVTCRENNSGTYKDFEMLVMNGDKLRSDSLTQATTEGIITEVDQNPNAIGYIGFAYFDNSVKALSLDKGNGYVAPTNETILNSTYPLSRSLNLYTNGESIGLTKDFIDFTLSKEGQNIVSKVGYIPLKK